MCIFKNKKLEDLKERLESFKKEYDEKSTQLYESLQKQNKLYTAVLEIINQYVPEKDHVAAYDLLDEFKSLGKPKPQKQVNMIKMSIRTTQFEEFARSVDFVAETSGTDVKIQAVRIKEDYTIVSVSTTGYYENNKFFLENLHNLWK